MRSSLGFPISVLTAVSILGSTAYRVSKVDAADNTWTNGAANSAWNTTSANWTAPAVWNNANVDSAIFGAAGVGTVTLGTPITARGLKFNTNGYAIIGSTMTLSAGGGGTLSVGEIEVTSASAGIDSTIAGTVGLTKTGDGTLNLTGTNTYTGGTTISAGSVQIGNGLNPGSIVGDVTNNGGLTFGNSGTTNFAGAISGTGTVNKVVLASTLVLTGANTYTGATTIPGNTTIRIGNGGTTGSIVSDVSNGGALAFNRSDDSIYAGTISGTGTVTKLGDGKLSLTETNTYTGITTISGGTLSIGAGASGSIVGDVVNNANLTFNRSSAAYLGVISGTGTVTIVFGNQSLGGPNTYTGATTVTNGRLTIGTGGTTGSIVSDVVNDANMDFFRSNNITYAGVISGTGAVTKLGAGMLSLTGDNTYTGVTTISNGILDIGGLGTNGSIVGNVVNNSVIRFSRVDVISYDGSISGSGSLDKQGGASNLTLTGANTYTGGTTISTGDLNIGVTNNPGSIVGDVLNNGALNFQNSGISTTFAGVISGVGLLTQKGINSTLILTGANTHTGGTTVFFGTLQIGNGGTTGSFVGNVTNQSALAFNRSNAIAYGGVVSGVGSLSKLGAGTLTLTAANTYTGTTTVSAGTLALTGTASVAGSLAIQVNAGAVLQVTGLTGGLSHDGVRFALGDGQTLTGTGTVSGGVNVGDGAILTAGGSLGTTSVFGNVDLQAGSKLGIQLQGINDTDADRSRLSLTGALTFAGTAGDLFTVDVTNFGSFTGPAAATYTIASAGSIASTGLNSPLTVVVGAGGNGTATNASNIRLRVSGFQPFEKFTLQKIGNSLVLSFVPFFEADFDENGQVNGADLALWRTGFGTPTAATHMQGDANADGAVDGDDLLVWQRQLGLGSPATAAAAAVPEPASLAMLCMGLLAVLRRPRMTAS